MLYKNISGTAKTFYGVTFLPGEVKDVTGYIHDKKFVRIFGIQEVERPAVSTERDLPKSSSVSGKRTTSKLEKEEETVGNGADNDQ